MVGIIDNKNLAQLVIKDDDSENYIKVNPESLANIIADTTKASSGIDATVQEHMDDTSIHLTKVDVQSITANNVSYDDLVSGDEEVLKIVKSDDGTVTFYPKDFNTSGYMTSANIIPEDDTITVTPVENSDDVKLRANIPDVSKMVQQRNIKSGDSGINIEYDENSNDVYIYGEGNQFKAGYGVEIVNGTINNTLPDQTITLTGGTNVTVSGTYPDFTINSTDVVRISDWEADTKYELDDMVVYQNALFRCVEAHTSEDVFISEYWKLIAGWQANRYYFTIEEEGQTDITLSQQVPDEKVLLINISGIVQQGHNYNLQEDKKTIRFIDALPVGSIVEVIVVGNVIMDTYDSGVNIEDWQQYGAYGVGNLVMYENNIYKCLEHHIATADFDKTKWQLICGYLKQTFSYTFDTSVTEVDLPVFVSTKDQLQVNVQHTILQASEYDLDSTGYKLQFNQSIDPDNKIEVTIYKAGTIQLPEIPDSTGKVNYFLTTTNDAENTQYILRSTEETLELLGLESLLDFVSYPNSIMTVNEKGTGYKYLTFNELAGKVGGNQLAKGLNISVTTSGYLNISSGSVLAESGDTTLNMSVTMHKDISEAWTKGYQKGSAIGTDLDDWVQPVMQGNLYGGYQIFTSDAITDREGWRAMDGLEDTGNGWFVNNKTATFMLECPQELILKGFEFYNTDSGSTNHSKQIAVWVGDESNVIGTFTAENSDNGYTKVNFTNNTEKSTIVGFSILSSYGQCCGAKEIRFIAQTESYRAKNHSYYVYLLGNSDGTADDVATSLYDVDTFADYLPGNYTQYALIGTYHLNNDYEIVDAFPNKELTKDWIEGTLNGNVYSNRIEERLYDSVNGRAVTVMEEFGESVPSNGRITFDEPFSNLFYVMVNGATIVSKDVEGFDVDNSITTSLSWVAKGYK